MPDSKNLLWTLTAATVVLLTASPRGLWASDKDLIPRQLPKEQRANLQRFLDQHEKPDRFVPADAKLVDAPASSVDTSVKATPDKPIKQYTAQIISHRPVPGQEQVQRVDVYYYRPNPEKGKPGITVRHTVDLTTGAQVGATEVLLKRHTPLAREELAEAVGLAQEKSAAVQGLYKERDKKAVHWEYLQMLINRKHEPHEPGDRVARLVFSASAAEGQDTPDPVRVVVNLTKGLVLPDDGSGTAAKGGQKP